MPQFDILCNYIHIQLAKRTTIVDHTQHSWKIVTVSRDLALSFFLFIFFVFLVHCLDRRCCCCSCFHDFWYKQNVNCTLTTWKMGRRKKRNDKITGGEQALSMHWTSQPLAHTHTCICTHCNHKRFAMTTWIKSNVHGQKNKITKNVSTSRIRRCIQFMTMCCWEVDFERTDILFVLFCSTRCAVHTENANDFWECQH